MTLDDPVLPSARLRALADQLSRARECAWPLPFGGSLWAELTLSEIDRLIVRLRECAALVAHLEAVADELATRHTPAPPRRRPPLRLAWSREEN